MRLFILNLLNKLPYRTRFGLTLSDILKMRYYRKFVQYKPKRKQYCLCGGKIITYGAGYEGWETICKRCDALFDED